MKQIIQLMLPVLLCTAMTGCGGCGPVVIEAGGACEQQTDCAKGLWCLGRVCQKAPDQQEARDGGGAATSDAARDAGQDAGADAGSGDDTDVGGCHTADVGTWFASLCSDSADVSVLTCNHVQGGFLVTDPSGCNGHVELGYLPYSTYAGVPNPPNDNLLAVQALATWDLPYGSILVVAQAPLDRIRAGERVFSVGPDQIANVFFLTASDIIARPAIGSTSNPGGYGTITFTALELERCGQFTLEVDAFLPDDEEPNTTTGYTVLSGSTICGRLEDKAIPDAPDAGQDAGADAGGDGGIDGGEDGDTDAGIVVQCGPSPTGKGGDMCLVPAGPFWMGCNEAVDDGRMYKELPYHQVAVPAFVIDKYEVTAGEYKSCVDSGECTTANTIIECNFNATGMESHPINCVDWNQSRAYCAWVGKRLPSEVEWEKAARGNDGRKYPWGSDSLDCDHAVMSVNPCANSGTSMVGSRPLGCSPFGLEDMIGNVMEWTEDDYHDGYLGAPTNGSAWVDSPRGPLRVIRGGAWPIVDALALRASWREINNPSGWVSYLGFRCAYSLLADLDGGTDAATDGAVDGASADVQDAGTPVDTGIDAGFDGGAPCEPNCPPSDMSEVSEGYFLMGCADAGATTCPNVSTPSHQVYLSAFRIDRNLVTMGDFQRCVNAEVCEHHIDDGTCFVWDGTSNWPPSILPQRFRGSTQPVVCVDWYQADAYCHWVGKRLPTEAQWEKAARGVDGRKYPWGDSPVATCDYVVMDDENAGGKGCGTNMTLPVGSKPLGQSPYGVLDMSGNAYEWVSDWFNTNYYAGSTDRDPQGPSSGTERVLRGGCWWSNPFQMQTHYRYWDIPSRSGDGGGFRCAVSVL